MPGYRCRRTRRGSGACFIATEVYGSYDAPETVVFRNFRDEVLAKSRVGRAFIFIYYRCSPTIVWIIRRNTFSKKTARAFVDKMRRILDGTKV